ncbi:Transcriptional regulator, LacI family protein [Nostocoides japonicum T1-X7]|uniref:Transcriptional regulator, LacI family protein n=1 Tax=Nostocoides japonicum T1-X7 TaxID=1194083 RepID=A0A077LSV7_9MICO|nr:Transcriptional regulator, LacI family protein [Tetrasphaera japonica T1-X7]
MVELPAEGGTTRSRGVAGAPSVTSHDVARLAGVSQTTVSRALRNVPGVPAATRDRVTRAAEALGYVPNQLGRSLVNRATRRIAMVMDLGNPLSPSLLTPVHDALAASGYQTLLFAEHRGRMDALEGLFDRSVDGAILSTVTLDSRLPYELERHHTPFVYLNRLSDLVERDSVSADDAGGSAQVARMLLDVGHRDFGLLLGPEMTSTSRDREAGFTAVLAQHHLAVPPEWIARTDFTEASGRAAFDEVMSAPQRPTALFCANDWMAVGALNRARELGIRVPEDLTIVGFDDLPVAGWATINLTTVANPVEDSSVAAAKALLHRLEVGPDEAYVHVVSPTRLVLRATHGAPPRR